MANVWATPSAGAWANQVEEEEQANGGALPDVPVPEEAFPTLGAAVKEPKKKKKGQTLSLGDFQTGNKVKHTGKAASEILKSLPTAPRGGDDKPPGGLGGGFRDYKGGREGGRGDERDGGFGDRDRDRSPEGPSKADASDSWGMDRKFVASAAPSRSAFGQDRGGGGFDGEDRRGRGDDFPSSRADTTDSWGKDKAFEPGPARGYDAPRGGGFGGGRDAEASTGPSAADTEDRWSRKQFVPSEAPARRGVEDRGDRWGGGSRGEEVSTSSSAGERPRLNLAPRTKPLPLPEVVPVAAPAAPEPKAEPTPAPAPVKKSNPFGAARPREEVLKEQGRDWKKEELELEHKSVDREETSEEKELRAKVEELQLRVAKGEAADLIPAEPAAASEEGGEVSEAAPKTVQEALDAEEARLLKLTASLDDKVRFAKGGGARGPARAW